MTRDEITFEIWDDAGSHGSITIPAPTHWYHRWLLRFAAWLWQLVADAQRPEPEPFDEPGGGFGL